MKKRDSPELFELLKKEGINFSKYKKEEPSKKEVVEETNSAVTIPLSVARSDFEAKDKVFPKLKSSFLTKTATRDILEENVISLSYNMAILIVLVILGALVGSFMLGMHFGEKAGVKTTGTSHTQRQPVVTPSETVAPSISKTQWVIRLIWFEDNPNNQNNANKRLATLKKQYPKDTFFLGKDIFQDKKQICLYVGPYQSKSDAEKNLTRWKQIYPAADLKELKSP